MKRRLSDRIVFMTVTAACLGAVAARAEETSQRGTIAVVNGVEAKTRSKPAALAYVSDAAEGSSYAIAAAVISPGWAIFGQGAALELDLGVGVRKNTVGGKAKSDQINAALAARQVWTVSPSLTLLSRAVGTASHNRLTQGDDNVIELTTSANAGALKWPEIRLPGGIGVPVKLFPFAGYYQVHTTGVAKGPNGRFGGPRAGFDFHVDLGRLGVKGTVPLLLVSAQRQWERQVGGDFKRDTYDVGVATLTFPINLFGDSGTQFSLTHTRGTDRVAREAWKRQTRLELSFQLGGG